MMLANITVFNYFFFGNQRQRLFFSIIYHKGVAILARKKTFSPELKQHFRLNSAKLWTLNSLPNHEFWTRPTVADDKSNVAKMIISVFDRVENIVVTGISPNPTMFSKGFFLELLEVGMVW